MSDISDKEIVYDIRLEISRDEILERIWISEEIQLQPEFLRESIIDNFNKINSEKKSFIV